MCVGADCKARIAGGAGLQVTGRRGIAKHNGAVRPASTRVSKQLTADNAGVIFKNFCLKISCKAWHLNSPAEDPQLSFAEIA